MKRLAFALVGLAVPAALWMASAPAGAAPTPPPARVDVPATPHAQIAVFAGGCFWGMEGVFEHVKGVRSVTSGYAGGKGSDASYEQVGTETTGHAESVRIVFDPKQVTYGQLLRIFFAEHDPTEVNRQTPDEGPSYRSAIFPQDPAQRKAAQAYIAQLGAAHLFGRPIATRVEAGGFYPAEAYHQGFLRRNPNHPYIRMWDAPKLVDLKHRFPEMWKA
jgi:peptide-methionine (S)-S-oxide reductase